MRRFLILPAIAAVIAFAAAVGHADIRNTVIGFFNLVNTRTATDLSVKSFAQVTSITAPTSPSANIETALWGIVEHQSTQPITGGGHNVGVLGWCQNSLGGTVDLCIGVEGKIVNNSTGTISNAVAFETQVANNNASGTITNVILNQARITANAGTISNLYGFYFPDQSSFNVATRRAFRSEDYAAAVDRKVGTGANSVYGSLAATIANATSIVATPDTAFNIICAGVIPANTLRVTGDRVQAKTYFTNAATANNKQVGLRIGANSLTSTVAAHNGLVTTITAELKRTGANTQTLVIEGRVGGVLFGPSYFAATETETADIAIWPLAQSAVAGEISCLGHDAVYYPAKG